MKVCQLLGVDHNLLGLTVDVDDTEYNKNLITGLYQIYNLHDFKNRNKIL